MSFFCEVCALGSARLRLSGKRRSRSDANDRRRSRRSHGVVITSMSPELERATPPGRRPGPRLGNFLRLLVAVEALLLEHKLGHAVAEEGNAAVVGLGYDPENSQGSNTAQLNSDATAR